MIKPTFWINEMIRLTTCSELDLSIRDKLKDTFRELRKVIIMLKINKNSHQ